MATWLRGVAVAAVAGVAAVVDAVTGAVAGVGAVDGVEVAFGGLFSPRTASSSWMAFSFVIGKAKEVGAATRSGRTLDEVSGTSKLQIPLADKLR